jgi:hypothetical protein
VATPARTGIAAELPLRPLPPKDRQRIGCGGNMWTCLFARCLCPKCLMTARLSPLERISPFDLAPSQLSRYRQVVYRPPERLLKGKDADSLPVYVLMADLPICRDDVEILSRLIEDGQ